MRPTVRPTRGDDVAHQLTTALTLALVLAACGSPGEPGGASRAPQEQSRVNWDVPESYTFTLDSSCGERALIGRFKITVADGAVEAVEGLDESGRSMLDHGFDDEIPTLTELLEEAETARSEGADAVEVDRVSDGHPTRIDIDWDTNAVDDEACYRITEYSPAGSPSGGSGAG